MFVNANTNYIDNIRVSQEGDKILVFYDVNQDVFVNDLFNKQKPIPLEYLSGDIDKKVLKGKDKVIVFRWTLCNDSITELLEGSYCFDVKYSVAIKTFIFANAGYSHRIGPSAGLMFGVHKKSCGWYIKGNTSFNFDNDCKYMCNRNGLIGEEKPFYTGNEKSTYFSVSTGMTLRLGCPLFLYYGLGYGQYSLFWELEGGQWVKNQYYSLRGLNSEVGLMGQIGMFAISAGVSNIKFKTVNFEFGVGVIF